MISFFRKYQKPLLLTAAIFALVTFSVTGPMLEWVGGCVQKPGEQMPRMTLPSGEVYQVTLDDWFLAGDIFNFFVQRMPFLDLGLKDEEQDETAREREREYAFDRLLILMCAARGAGIGVSDRLVADFARSPLAQYWLQIQDQRSYEQAISQRFNTSVERFEAAFTEFVRIRFYIDSLTLGENLSILSVLEKAAKEGEELEAGLVRFAAGDHEEALKREETSDQALLAFLDGLESGEKFEFLDRKLVDLELAWVPVETSLEELRGSVAGLEPAAGSPARTFLEDLDKLPPVSDPLVERRYDQDKATLYVKESPASRPASAPASRPAGEDAGETAEDPVDPRPDEKEFLPLDEPLKERIRASLMLEKALGLVFSQVKAAALEQGKEFDMAAFLKASFPFMQVVRTGLQREPNLAKIAPLEGWSLSYQALAPAEGEFCPTVYNSRTAQFFARVAAVKENEPRPIDEIRDSLKAVYVKKEARNRAEKAGKEFLAKLRELGREARPEEVAKIDAEVAEAADRRLADRKGELDASLARLEKTLADPTLPARFRADYEAALARVREELEALPGRRADLVKEEEQKREADRKTLELKEAGLRFGAAVEAVGARVVRVDPFPRNLNQIDRDAVDEEKDDGVRFLKSAAGVARLAELETGAVTELIEDHSSRSFLVLHLVGRKDRPFSALTPREVDEQLQRRRREAPADFASKAFRFEELRRRFDYRNFRQEKEYKARLEAAPQAGAAPPAPAAGEGGAEPPAQENQGSG